MEFTKDLIIKGKHAIRINEIKELMNINGSLPTFIDIYLTCGALGIVNDLSTSTDRTLNEEKIIPRTVLSNRFNDIDFLYQTAALKKYMFDSSNKEKTYKEEKAIQAAFETGKEHQELERFKIFNNHALAGIDYVYERLEANMDKEIVHVIADIFNENKEEIQQMDAEFAEKTHTNYLNQFTL